jgi:AbrB family looped-hinge helix DNA binding protein
METVTLSSKGQLVIPKGVRQAARLTAGDHFSVCLVDGEIRLKPLLAPAVISLDEVAGCLAKPGRRKLSDQQTRAAINARLKAVNAPR